LRRADNDGDLNESSKAMVESLTNPKKRPESHRKSMRVKMPPGY